MTAPSMTTPAVAYFHRAMRSLRASATIVVLRERPPCLRTLSWNHRLSAEPGWCRSHNQANCIMAVRSRVPRLGHPLFAVDRSTLPRRRR